MKDTPEPETNSITPERRSPASCSALAEQIPEEIERCQELLHAYAEIGPAGNFGSAMIKQDIKAATTALASGDIVEMIRAYEALKGCK